MEKPAKPKNKFLKLLPRAASVVAFQNQPFSPSRDNKLKVHAGRALPGSIIPAEARLTPKNSGFDPQEPTSPKVSCMGQIKHKKKMKKTEKEKQKQKGVSLPKDFRPVVKPWTARLGAAEASPDKPTWPDRAPSLSQMKRFSSGRDSVALAEVGRRNYYSGEESEEEEREVIIPFSAPIVVIHGGGGSGGDVDEVGLKPRKEINLWKRRTMTQPRPLHVHTVVA